MDEHENIVGQRIRRRLAEMDHDQRWLAQKLGCSESKVSRWLKGERRMSVPDLQHISLVLHRSVGWLTGESDLVTA